MRNANNLNQKPNSDSSSRSRRVPLRPIAPLLAAVALLPAAYAGTPKTGSPEATSPNHGRKTTAAQAAGSKEPITPGHAKQPGVIYEQFTERADQWPAKLGGEGWIKTPEGVAAHVKVTFQDRKNLRAAWQDINIPGSEESLKIAKQADSTTRDEKIEVPISELAKLAGHGEQLRLLVDYTIGQASDPSRQTIPVISAVQPASLRQPGEPHAG